MSACLFSDETRVSATSEHLSSELGEGAVILDLKSGVYFGLDAVGARVWELLQQSQSMKAICQTIVSEFDVTLDVCRQDVLRLMGQMHAQGLIRIASN